MTLYMKADIHAKWMEELRSGKYRQGSGELHYIGYKRSEDGTPEPSDERFCCLGILCKMAADAGAVEAEIGRSVVAYGGDGETTYLPEQVIEWAGLKYEGERVHTNSNIEESRGILVASPDGRVETSSLAVMNDSGVPFDEIADVIKNEIIPV